VYSVTHQCFWVLAKSSISDHDLDILCPFAMKTRNNLTASVFNEILYSFSKEGMESLANMQSHVQYLSHFKLVEFPCCVNLCVSYVGPYADLDECPKCEMSCLNKSGRAR